MVIYNMPRMRGIRRENLHRFSVGPMHCASYDLVVDGAATRIRLFYDELGGAPRLTVKVDEKPAAIALGERHYRHDLELDPAVIGRRRHGSP